MFGASARAAPTKDRKEPRVVSKEQHGESKKNKISRALGWTKPRTPSGNESLDHKEQPPVDVGHGYQDNHVEERYADRQRPQRIATDRSEKKASPEQVITRTEPGQQHTDSTESQPYQQSRQLDPRFPPFSSMQSYTNGLANRGTEPATISESSAGLNASERRLSEGSFLPGQDDEDLVNTRQDEETQSDPESPVLPAHDIPEYPSSPPTQERKQTPQNRKPVPAAVNESRPLPLVPFDEAVSQQFWQRYKDDPWSGNRSDHELVTYVVKVVSDIASKERCVRMETGSTLAETEPNTAALASQVASLSKDTGEKATTIETLRGSRDRLQIALSQKEKELSTRMSEISQRNTEIINLRAAELKYKGEVNESVMTVRDLRISHQHNEGVIKAHEKTLSEQAARVETLQHNLNNCTKELSAANTLLKQAQNERAAEVNSLVRKHGENVQNLEIALRKDYEKKLGKKDKEVAASQNALEDIRSKRKDVDTKHANAIAELKRKHNESLEKKEQTHVNAMAKLKTEVGNAASEKATLVASHKEALRLAKQEHDRALVRRDDEHDEEVERLTRGAEDIRRQADADKEKLRSSHTKAIESLTMKHDAAIAALMQAKEDLETKLTGEHRTEKTNLEQQVIALKEKHEADRKQLNDNFETEKAQLIATHETNLETLTTTHETEKSHLQRQVQELNAALLNRDEDEFRGTLFKTIGLPKKPDEKLREILRDIQHMVEDLGRLPWKPDQVLWTEQVIERVRGQHVPRILKKAIVQDLVWGCLWQAIFVSPWRVFGEEGKKLEGEWFEQCSQDPPLANEKFPWPTPGAHAERWRYMTMRECREALTKPSSELDARSRIRQGFMTSVDALSVTLKEELGGMVELEPEHSQLVDRLSKRAAANWLDFEMHRCRIVLRLTGSELESSEEKVAQLQKGSLALTISPKLGRYGTVKGVELERFMVIDGCGGDSLKLP